MDQFKVSTPTLVSAADAVDKVATALDAATTDTEGLADAVGHTHLASQVRSFATSWDKRRADLTEQLVTLSTNLRDGAESIQAADQGLADAVRGESA